MMVLRTKRIYIFIFVVFLVVACIHFIDIHKKVCECNTSYKKEGLNIPSKLKCIADGARAFQCLRYGNDVYLPFDNFIKKQFEVTGHLVGNANEQRFEYFTSYAKIRLPDFIEYDPFSVFGHFGSYNVEIRERVRCINPEFGVPMSIQWDSIPYFYPIQIAQFALQHYSRNLTDKPPKIKIIDIMQLVGQDHVIKTAEDTIKTSSDEGIIIALDDDPVFTVLIFSWVSENEDAAFSVTVKDNKMHRVVKLFYKFIDDRRCVWSVGDVQGAIKSGPKIQSSSLYNYTKNITTKSRCLNFDPHKYVFTYSLGKHSVSSRTVVRDILVDINKALALVEQVSVRNDGTQNGGLKISDIHLLSLKFYGNCIIKTPVKQQTKAHHEMFLQSSEWLLKAQDKLGGWPVPVKRAIADNQLILPIGWVSAMAQGHSLSVLTRAFHATNDHRFVKAGKRALQLFKMPASKGGVKNSLFGYDWYEEYPTTPGTFVLNGFLYSLIGLYDFAAIAPDRNESMELFNTGIKSLVEFIQLYDTGSGSIYDLRHLSLKSAPNLARWDYHAVHVYLLKWLYIITKNENLNKVANRWVDYAHGKKAKHN